MLDFAAQIGDQLPAKTRLSSAMLLGGQLAPLGEEAIKLFAQEWNKPAQVALWGGAVKEFSGMGDLESARRSLQTLEALLLDPQVVKASAAETGARDYSTSPELVIEGARSAYLRVLSQQDPAAALRESAILFKRPAGPGKSNPVRALLSSASANFTYQNVLLWIANDARSRGDKATAITALHQVFEFKIANTDPYALAAWYGAQIDPALGEELFAKARARLESKSSFRGSKSVGDIAFYLAHFDPAQSRLLIEREWLEIAPSLTQKTIGVGEPNPNSSATKLVRAMLIIDPARAVEMIAQLERTESGSSDKHRVREIERSTWIAALVTDAASRARGDLNAQY
ncbi:hypothetical protein EON80_12640 [bacterium]|nr:MAG: hypothetical protein EON80_12640 [bacterium]